MNCCIVLYLYIHIALLAVQNQSEALPVRETQREKSYRPIPEMKEMVSLSVMLVFMTVSMFSGSKAIPDLLLQKSA